MASGVRRDAVFVRRVLIVVAIGAMALLLWRLVDLLLMVFGAVLVAVLLRALAEPIARRTRLSNGWALGAATLALLAAIGVAVWLFGAEVRAQVAELIERLPQAWRSFEERLGMANLGQRLVDRAEDVAPAAGSVLSGVAGVVTSFVGGLADLLLFGGLYLAAQLSLYRHGFLLLLPPGGSRQRLADTLDETGAALRRWLLGQVVSMMLVFVLTGLGLWAMPSTPSRTKRH
jgi:predicted PurR-regulated permease PerM